MKIKNGNIIISLFLILSIFFFAGCSEIAGIDTDEIIASQQTQSSHPPDTIHVSGSETYTFQEQQHISGA